MLNLSLKPPSRLFRGSFSWGFGAGFSFMKTLFLQGLGSVGSVGICHVQRIPSLAASLQAEKRNLVSISHSYWNATIWLWKWKVGLSCVVFFHSDLHCFYWAQFFRRLVESPSDCVTSCFTVVVLLCVHPWTFVIRWGEPRRHVGRRGIVKTAFDVFAVKSELNQL